MQIKGFLLALGLASAVQAQAECTFPIDCRKLPCTGGCYFTCDTG